MKPAMAFPMALVALLSAACATAAAPDAPAGADDAPATGSKFETLADGSVWHPASKGRCPETLAGFTYREPTLFKADGSDVGCEYKDDARASYLTVYFYRHHLLDDAMSAAEDGAIAIRNRFPDADYMADESRECSRFIDLMKGIDAAYAATGDTEIVVGVTPCVIYRIEYGATLLATDMVGPWHLKVRVTGPLTDEGVTALSLRAANVMRLQHGWMSGLPADFAESAP